MKEKRKCPKCKKEMSLDRFGYRFDFYDQKRIQSWCVQCRNMYNTGAIREWEKKEYHRRADKKT